MKIVALLVGLVMFVVGLHWIGQGTGYFPWPANPAMVGDSHWTYYGVGMAVLGYLVVWLSRRNTA